MKSPVSTERLYSILEYILGFIFMCGGVNTGLSHPIDTPSVFYHLLAGTKIALIAYGIFFFIVGASMWYSKWKKKKKFHKNTLMVMFIIGVYAILLSTAIFGPTASLIPNVLVTIASGCLWLRWKMRTEYLDPKLFRKDIVEIRTDRKD